MPTEKLLRCNSISIKAVKYPFKKYLKKLHVLSCKLKMRLLNVNNVYEDQYIYRYSQYKKHPADTVAEARKYREIEITLGAIKKKRKGTQALASECLAKILFPHFIQCTLNYVYRLARTRLFYFLYTREYTLWLTPWRFGWAGYWWCRAYSLYRARELPLRGGGPREATRKRKVYIYTLLVALLGITCLAILLRIRDTRFSSLSLSPFYFLSMDLFATDDLDKLVLVSLESMRCKWILCGKIFDKEYDISHNIEFNGLAYEKILYCYTVAK